MASADRLAWRPLIKRQADPNPDPDSDLNRPQGNWFLKFLQVIRMVLYFLWLPCCTVLNSINKEKGRLERQTGNNQLETAPNDDGNGGLLSMKERTDPDPGKRTDPEVYAHEGLQYDVFLSFRGTDYRKSFIDCLYHRLDDAGVCTFKDDEELPVGGEIGPELMRAIKQSKISIPIFSKDYASSKWCLKEVTEMMKRMDERKHIVMPIFLDVTPNEVQHQSGSYTEAFSQHDKKYDSETVQEWRDALQKVVKLRGLELKKEANGNQGEFIKLVLARVLNSLKKGYVNVNEEALKILLDVGGSGVKTVGIWGMGGIGKTTLAKVVYNQMLDQFASCCFLNDIRETERRKGLPYLQNKLVSDILNERSRDFASVDEGIQQLKCRLGGKKSIILLDDVDHVDQLKGLAGSLAWFGPGSRIIITTRDKEVLQKFEVNSIYEVMPLSEDQGFELFCKHAFLKGSPTPDFVELARDIVRATGMLPLTLEVIGSYLSTKIRHKKTWQDTLKKLEAKPGKEVQDRLELSYDALEITEKNIFLDIACIFIGMDLRTAIPMWDDRNWFPHIGIEILVSKSLIKITDENELRMHDQIRDLGRAIVESESYNHPGSRSRLWRREEANNVLKRNEGTAEVEAISLGDGDNSTFEYEGRHFRNLSKLKILRLGRATLRGKFKGLLPELRWLSWQVRYASVTPTDLELRNLISLDLSGSEVSEDWGGWILMKDAPNLKVINLTSCHQLGKTPNFSSFPHIEMLFLKDCTALSAVDASIGLLEELKSLDLRNCGSLEKLPDEIGFLEQLEDLFIDGCPVHEIPISVAMKKLRTLSAKSCRLLSQLPLMSIELLVGLEELLLDNCESLTELPASIGQLNSLKVLSLSYSKVSQLPDSFQNSSNLKVLNIDHCPMRSLPRSLWNLERIEVLNASGCLNLCGEIPFELTNWKLLRILRLDHTSVTGISRSIVGLSRLETLDLEGCMKLQILPVLPTSLINLKVTLTAEAIPNLIDLINLRQLETRNCRSDLVQGTTPEEPSSSSSFTLQPGYKYEVFLSFRGPDTRKTFTDSLYCRLDDAGIRTFRDGEELHLGEEMGPELLEAIEQSRVSIPIFSTGYASSKWCLMEVAKMVECMSSKKQIIIPIFYDVTPYQVRHQTGTYVEAFSIHEKSEKFTTETVCKWRDALAEVGSLKGRDLTIDGYHGKVSREIVSEVLKLLKKPYLDVTEHLVGVGDHMENVMKLLEIETDDNRVVGISGMGGIGKTTIAKFIYNQLRDEFEYCSFLNIRDGSLMSKGLESLQRQLASDVLRRKCEKFANIDAGKAELTRSLRDKKVLILVDDVDKTEQLNNLVGKLSWLGQGSRIIITTRNVDALRMSDVFRTAPKNNALVYEVGAMHPQNAFLLFCKHAFRQDFPIPRFAIISWNIVEATGRLPLAVEAIGSYLSNFQEKTKVWEEALQSLKKRTDILGTLKISYEGLSREQQEVFLDIVCLFIGKDSRIPVHVWKARGFSPETTIEDLILRSLIRIGDNNELLMHDLYIELGREIIREESKGALGKQSRLWCREDAIHVLQHEKGTESVRAVNLDNGIQSKKCCFSPQKFKKLPNVWFLGLGDANLEGRFHGCLSDLRWLSHHGYDFYIPDGLNLESLVVLDLSRSTITENWDGWSSLKDAENLEVLNLSSCHRLISTPNFPPLPRMKRLILEDCRALSVVGPSIMELKALEFLDMRNCSSLRYLPKELGSLGALTELLLDGSSVRELTFSRTMEDLEIISAKSSRSLTRLLWWNEGPLKLKKLFLDNCESLRDIPDSIRWLHSLTDLSLSHTSVTAIPESVGNLCNLELFNIDHCPIRILPCSLWKLEKLEVISASRCLHLEGEIPSAIGNLTRLRILRLDHTNVSSISPAIKMLPGLHILNLKECKIRTLPNLPSSLVSLKVTCMSSVTIPNPSDLVHLKELEVVLLDRNAKVAKEVERFSKIEKVRITII